MKKYLLLILLLLPISAQAQNATPVSPRASLPTLATMQNAAVANGNGTVLTVTGQAVATLTVNCSSCSGGTTINFEGTEDGTNFVSVFATQIGTSTIATSTTTSGITVWEISPSALRSLRARISAYSAGTITITGRTHAVGGNQKIVNANVLASGTAITATGSSLNINCTGGCGAPAAFTDNSAFTAGTSSVANQGAVFNDGLAAVTSGNAAAPRITAQRALHANLRTNAGVEVPFPAALGANGGLKIEGVASGTVVPISGTVTANAGTNLNTSTLALSATQTDRTQKTQITDGTRDGTVKAASTLPVATDTAVVVTLRDTPAVTLTSTTITGTVDVSDRAARLVGQVEGRAASGAAKAGNPVQIGGVFNTTQPTVTTGQAVEAQSTARGAQIVATGTDTLNVTVNAALPAGTAVIGHVINDSGSTTAVTGNVTVVQPTGTNLHAVLDSTSTTAVTQATASNLNAAVVGTGTAGAPAGNILTVQGVASMTKLLVTPDSVALPANQSVNLAQVAGAATNTGNGTAAGSQRVSLASDSTGQVTIATGANTIGAVTGTKTNNNAVPGATNVGALVAVSTTSAPSYTEGNLVALSVDNTGSLRTSASAAAVNDVTATGDLVATGSVTTATLNGSTSVGAYIFGTWVATVQFEASIDGTNYVSVNAVPITGGTLVSSTAANGQWQINSGGYANVRARVSAFTSGTVSIRLRSSTGPGIIALSNSLPTGSNVIGALSANQSVNAAQLNGTTTDTNSGVKSAGTLRVVLATDQPALTNKLLVTPDSVALPANQSVNVAQVAGTTTVTGGVAGIIAVGGNVPNAGTATANPVPVGGIFTTTPATLTTGQTATLQFTAAQNVKQDITTIAGTAPTSVGKLDVKGADGDVFVRQATAANLNATVVGTLADNGAAAGTNRDGVLPGIAQTSYNNGTASTQGRNAAQNIGTDGLLWVAALPAIRPASYSTSATVSSAASATDIAVLSGNATNIVLVTRVKCSCTQTTAGIITLNIIKRSAADTGGTSASMTIVPDDSTYAAGSSAALTYTANPTTGTSVGNVDTYKIGCMAAATATPNDVYILNRTQKPIVLRGTAQQLAVNLNGVTVTGGSFSITYEYMEITTISP